MGTGDELLRSWTGGHLAAWALWVLMHINKLVRRAVLLSDSSTLPVSLFSRADVRHQKSEMGISAPTEGCSPPNFCFFFFKLFFTL